MREGNSFSRVYLFTSNRMGVHVIVTVDVFNFTLLYSSPTRDHTRQGPHWPSPNHLAVRTGDMFKFVHLRITTPLVLTSCGYLSEAGDTHRTGILACYICFHDTPMSSILRYCPSQNKEENL